MRDSASSALIFAGGAGMGSVAAASLAAALGQTAALFALVVGGVVTVGSWVTARGGSGA